MVKAMNVLITGGAGFLGTLLTREILKRATLQGQPIRSLTVTDLVAPSHPDVVGHPLLRIELHLQRHCSVAAVDQRVR